MNELPDPRHLVPTYLGVYCRRCREDCIPINGICPWCSTDLKPADDPARLPPSSPLGRQGASLIDAFEVDGELIEIVGPRQARVKSQSQAELWYALDADSRTCTCRGFEIRKTCRHLDAFTGFLEGRAQTAADAPTIKMELFTGRYSDAETVAFVEAGGLAVRITLGHPRFALKYTLAGTCMSLAPKGLKDVADDAEFERLYRERLDGFGVERLRRELSAIAAPFSRENDPARLVLCCYEDLRKPDEFCHRTVFGAWWQERTGEKVEELGGAAPATLLDAPGGSSVDRAPAV